MDAEGAGAPLGLAWGRVGVAGRWEGLAVDGRDDGLLDGREAGVEDGREGGAVLGRDVGRLVDGRDGAVLDSRLGPLDGGASRPELPLFEPDRLPLREPPFELDRLALREPPLLLLDRLALRDPLLPRLPPRDALRDPPERPSARISTGRSVGASARAGPEWNQASRVRVVSIGPPGSVGSALTAWTPQGGVVFDQSGSIAKIDRPGWP